MYFSRYPTWHTDSQPLDVRPPSLQKDDSVYIDDDDIYIIKTEECERQNVFTKSTTPYLGPTPLASIVISDSDDSDYYFTDDDTSIRGKSDNFCIVAWLFICDLLNVNRYFNE